MLELQKGIGGEEKIQPAISSYDLLTTKCPYLGRHIASKYYS